jgi:RNA polymerase sigma factor (sigma-70 family)
MLPPHTPYRLLSDERLARLAARRDERAFSSLYLRHESALLAYCRSITRDPDDARDALQSAMASAYAAVPDRANGGPVRAWLFRIAHNESIDVLRRRRVDLPLVDSDLTPAPSAADETARREAAHEALAEVAQLPPRQRGALVLRELHGLDYREIASALSVSEVNARQLVFAARAGVTDSRAGQRLPCEFVRDAIDAGDRRAQRRRPLQAHLRTCEECRAYARATRRRSRRIVTLPGGWLAGWAPFVGGTAPSASGGAGELIAPAKGMALIAIAAAVAGAAAHHQHPISASHAAAVAASHAATPAAPATSQARTTRTKGAAPASHAVAFAPNRARAGSHTLAVANAGMPSARGGGRPGIGAGSGQRSGASGQRDGASGQRDGASGQRSGTSGQGSGASAPSPAGARDARLCDPASGSDADPRSALTAGAGGWSVPGDVLAGDRDHPVAARIDGGQGGGQITSVDGGGQLGIGGA